MAETDREKWDRIYRSPQYDDGPPATILTQNLHSLPGAGQALDLACGTGANALQLSSAGLKVDAWDISQVALDRLKGKAAAIELTVTTQQRDISLYPPEINTYDVIVVSRFLDRAIIPDIIAALRPYGLIFYQTWTRRKPAHIGPSNPDYLLARNELLELFSGLAIVVYREMIDIHDPGYGEAMLIAQKG